MGPTASGKSALAMNLAQRMDGVIINADAMQMYADLRILTARPTETEEAQIPHRLYGVLGAHEDSSVAVWLERVVPTIRAAWRQGRQPLLVGGTGMYIKALMEGLAEIPPVPDEIRLRARTLGKEALAMHDPLMDARLKPGDTQRRLRALEVILATGQSLAHWQAQKTATPLPEAFFDVYKIDRPREEIYARIDQRFAEMIENGALEEVKALQRNLFKGQEGSAVARPSLESRAAVAPGGACTAQNKICNLQILKSHGVPEILAYFAGEMSLEKAMLKAQQNTRNYAKRQMTWLRNQLPEAMRVEHLDDILDHLP